MKRQKVIFFGRYKDKYSIKCVEHLKSLGFETTIFWSTRRGEKFPSNIEKIDCDYIFCFRSHFIIPKQILSLPKCFPINFHPGSPDYPGTGGINFALYEQSLFYGVTCHIMDQKVDSGKIIYYKLFPINKKDNLPRLLLRTHKELLKLFIFITKKIQRKGKSFLTAKLELNDNVEWGNIKRTQKDLDSNQFIDPDISEKELKTKIRSFHIDGFPLVLKLHNYKFVLDREDNSKKID